MSNEGHNPIIPTRTLGRTGRTVTALGLGGAAMWGRELYGRTSTEAESVACVHAALNLGIRVIDTSPLYGDSERRIGLALADKPIPRTELFLSTKTGTGSTPHDYTADGTRFSVQRSLERLHTDYVDLLLIHDPEEPGEWEAALAPGAALDVLLDYKRQGIVRAIGLGMRSHQILSQALHDDRFDAILTFADFNPITQTAREALLPDAEKHNKGVLLGSPLLFGSLTDGDWEPKRRGIGDVMTGEQMQKVVALRDWCHRRDISITALTLQYELRDPRISIVLTGAGTVDEITANVHAVTTPLPPAIWDELRNDLGIA